MRSRILLPLLLVLACAADGAAAPKRPNILFILSDDQSYKTVGCYPEAWPWVRTPHLDRLAAGGVRFHAAYLGAWCMPSRATLLTGRHPHGVESMRMEGKYPASAYDPRACPFWPAVLRQQGYHTAHIGKWHTGLDAGWGRDWDRQIVWNRPLHPENAGAYYERQLLAIDGVEQWVEGYPADNYTRWACEYIRGEKRDPSKPWYLWLCYGSVHGPAKPAERHRGLYSEASVPLPADIFPPRPGKPAYLTKTQAWTRGDEGQAYAGKSGETFGDEGAKKAKAFEAWVRQVNECVPAIDEGVGQLVAALRETGQLENTLIVYSADQGFGMGEHGFRSKLAPYDATYRSPLIVSMPGRVAAGQVCAAPVNGADLVATFCAVAGVQVPWALHGRDLSALLREPASRWPHACLYEFTGDRYGAEVARTVREQPAQATYHEVPWYTAVVREGWKYVRYLEPGAGEELYDLRGDPEELTNVAAAPEQASRLAGLREAMRDELRRTEAGFGEKAE
jgi:arylsulfatase A-like enzyme